MDLECNSVDLGQIKSDKISESARLSLLLDQCTTIGADSLIT